MIEHDGAPSSTVPGQSLEVARKSYDNLAALRARH
jgi:hypothetical protein